VAGSWEAERRPRILQSDAAAEDSLEPSAAHRFDADMSGATVEFAYKKSHSGGFQATLEAVERAARARGFAVAELHDIRKTLATKGFDIRPLSIFELTLTSTEVVSAMDLLLPVRINVYEEGETVWVAALKPTLFCQVYPEHELDELAERWEKDVMAVVDAATGGN
jgi:uncharacterized protein (DUF302 family)